MTDYDSLAKNYIAQRKNKTQFDYNRDIEVPALIKMVGSVKNKTILDLGCGFGDHAKKLSKQRYKKLIGIDISKELLNFANKQNIHNTEFYQGDMNKQLKFDDSTFDVVYSGLAIHYIKNINILFNEVNRVLKKGGLFCFSTQHPIFNMINQTKMRIIGSKKKDNRQVIYGNYFDRSPVLNELGQLRFYNFNYETLIQSGLKSGFELIDYKDARPTKACKKRDPEKYKLVTTLPTFILFKFKKT